MGRIGTRIRFALAGGALLVVALAATAYAAFGFRAPQPHDVEGADPYPVAIADLNRDGRKDVIVGSEANATISILYGGKHGLKAHVEEPAGIDPFWLDVGDLNGDHRPDIVVTNDTSSPGGITILLAKRKGGFKAPIHKAVTSGPYQGVLSDLNGDGKLDLAVASNGENEVQVFHGSGDGKFHGHGHDYLVTGDPVAVVPHDFNGDGRADLAVLQSDSQVALLAGRSTGYRKPVYMDSGTSDPYGMVAGNFDSDHRLDLAVAGCSGSPQLVSLLHATKQGFKPFRTFPEPDGSCAYQPDAADLNGDGRTDLITVAEGSGNAIVHYGRKNGTLSNPHEFSAVVEAYSVAAGDINHDGVQDLAVPDYSSTTVSILLGKK